MWLARQAMAGEWQAVMVIAALSLIGIVLPPIGYLAMAVITLTTLQAGPSVGLKVMMFAFTAFAVVSMIGLNQPQLMLVALLGSWLPVYGLTLVLGYQSSIASTLLVGAIVSLMLLGIFYLTVGDTVQWWREVTEPYLLTQFGQIGINDKDAATILTSLLPRMTGLVITMLLLNSVIAVLIGRAWQAALYSPGQFAIEFQQMMIGKAPALVTAIVLVASVIPSMEKTVIQEILPIVLTLFALQGLAIIHALVRQKQQTKVWLIVTYILLLFMLPEMVVMLAVLGILEQWFNFRQRALASGE